jgi:hypothetical protein
MEGRRGGCSSIEKKKLAGGKFRVLPGPEAFHLVKIYRFIGRKAIF